MRVSCPIAEGKPYVSVCASGVRSVNELLADDSRGVGDAEADADAETEVELGVEVDPNPEPELVLTTKWELNPGAYPAPTFPFSPVVEKLSCSKPRLSIPPPLYPAYVGA